MVVLLHGGEVAGDGVAVSAIRFWPLLHGAQPLEVRRGEVDVVVVQDGLPPLPRAGKSQHYFFTTAGG